MKPLNHSKSFKTSAFLATILCIALFFIYVTGKNFTNHKGFKIDYLTSVNPIYRSYSQLLQRINEERQKNPELVDEILKNFNSCLNNVRPVVEEKNLTLSPIIAIEYLEPRLRRLTGNLSRKIADALKGQVLTVTTLTHYKSTLAADSSVLGRAYYWLGTYAMSQRAIELRRLGVPVIINRYWNKHSAFNIHKKFSILPNENHYAYKYPKDLIAPDLVFCIADSGLNKSALNNRLLKIYRTFRRPEVDVLWFYNKKCFWKLFKYILRKISYLPSSDALEYGNLKSFRKWSDDYSLGKYPVFKTYSQVLKRLSHEKKNGYQVVDKILDIGNRIMNRTVKKFVLPKMKNRKPFIVVAGNNIHNSIIIAKKLASRMGANFVRFTPTEFREINITNKSIMSDSLKRTFLGFCNYVVANRTRHLLNSGIPVITTGCWTLQTAAAMKRIFTTFEIKRHFLYKHPEDLLSPDMIIYIKHGNKTMESRTEKFLKLFRKPNVTIYTVLGNIDQGYQDIHNLTVQQLNRYRNMKFTGLYLNPLTESYKELLVKLKFEKEREPVLAEELLETFEKIFKDVENYHLPEERRVPFIVIDGDNKTVTKDVLEFISRLKGTKVIDISPGEIYRYWKELPKNSKIQSIFYNLCLHVDTIKAKLALSNGIQVVANGYWPRSLCYYILFKNSKNPNKRNAIYNRPNKDFLRPDLIIYLENKKSFYKSITRKRRLDIYRNFWNVNLEVVGVEGGFEKVQEVVLKLIEEASRRLNTTGHLGLAGNIPSNLTL